MDQPVLERNHARGQYTVYVADLTCILCGSEAGRIESNRVPLPSIASFLPRGGSHATVAEWRRLRCARCGGSLVAEDVTPVERYPVVIEDESNRPRRGRPPKWLLEQRRQAQDSAERALG